MTIENLSSNSFDEYYLTLPSVINVFALKFAIDLVCIMVSNIILIDSLFTVTKQTKIKQCFLSKSV